MNYQFTQNCDVCNKVHHDYSTSEPCYVCTKLMCVDHSKTFEQMTPENNDAGTCSYCCDRCFTFICVKCWKTTKCNNKLCELEEF